MKREHEDLKSVLEERYHDFSLLDEKFHSAVNSVVKNRFVLEAQKLIKLIFNYHYMWDKRDELERNAAAIEEIWNGSTRCSTRTAQGRKPQR